MFSGKDDLQNNLFKRIEKLEQELEDLKRAAITAQVPEAAPTGTVVLSGWVANGRELTDFQRKIVLNAAERKITIGDEATGGAGIQLDYSGQLPLFYVGDGDSKYLYWDGVDLNINGATITESDFELPEDAGGAAFAGQFYVQTGYPDRIFWTYGTLTTSGGSYSILAGDAAVGAEQTFLYFDASQSTSSFLATADSGEAVGSGRIIVAVAYQGTDEVKFISYVTSDTNISGDQIEANSITANEIAAGTITGNEIAANTITADRLNVSNLSAIAADMGLLTAGEVRLGNGSPGTDFTGIRIYGDGTDVWLRGYDNDELNVEINSNGQFMAGEGALKVDRTGIRLDPVLGKLGSGWLVWENGGTHYLEIKVDVDLSTPLNSHIYTSLPLIIDANGTSIVGTLTGDAILSNGEIQYNGDLQPVRGGTTYTGYAIVPMIPGGSSTAWDGDAKPVGTYAVNVADFGVPAEAKIVWVRLAAKWNVLGGYYAIARRPGGGDADYGPIASARSTTVDSDAGAVVAEGGQIEVVIVGADAAQVWLYVQAYAI